MCPDCNQARTTQLHALYDVKCPWCGARLIRRIQSLKSAKEALQARMRAVLADWIHWGHDEQSIRALVKQGKTLQPLPALVETPTKKTKKKRT